MLHFKLSDRYFISEDLHGFATKLTEEGVFPRRLDLLFLGFGYAVQNQLPLANDLKKRDLTQVGPSLDEDDRFAYEALTAWYAKKLGVTELSDDAQLLDLFCRVGIAGVQALQKRWEGKGKSQIIADVLEKLALPKESGSDSAL